MKSLLAPQKIISFSALFLLGVIAFASYLATDIPWLGLTLGSASDGQSLVILEVDDAGPATDKLQPGEGVNRILGSGIALEAGDLMEEPDALSAYRDYNAFLARQSALYRGLTQSQVALELEDGRVEMLSLPPHRPLSSLPLLFWYQLACGGIVFMAGMSVLAFRPRERVTFYYALTGFGLLIASSTAAIYSTRELALDGDLFYLLSITNQLGSLIFAGPFISILWYYPQRIHRFPLGPVFIGYYMFCWVLNVLQVFESLDLVMRLPILTGLLVTLSLALIQWRATRTQPVQRAILKWFLLAWLTGTSLYLGLHTLPLVLGLETAISQSLGWGILLTVYLGIALGITRYRLFNLDRWVITGWFWFLGGIVVIALDGLLISLLELNNHLALATALALAGWLYFPLRQILWRRFSWHYRRSIDYRELLPSLLTTVLNTRPSELPREWTQLLQYIFAPLSIEPTDKDATRVTIGPEGSSLILPPLGEIRGQKLIYADRGSRLFNDEDRHLAEALHILFNRIQSFRQAFNDGVLEERRRLARDLHDDVGAKVLTLVYSAESEQQADVARETLQELRDVIRNLEHAHYSLSHSLGEMHRETLQRCNAREMKLLWNSTGNLSDCVLEPRQQSNLVRIVREAVTNALRHSDTDTLQIDIEQSPAQIRLYISNNHARLDEKTAHKPGRGMSNIQSRARELGGSAEWRLGEESLLGGYTVVITIPFGEQVENEERIYS